MNKTGLFIMFFAVMALVACNNDAPAPATDTPEETTTAPATETVTPEASTENVVATTTLSVDRMDHDFGDIPEAGGNVETTFTVTNSGSNPLLISEAKGSCGCTVPDYPRDPIQPGESREIAVSFDPKGKQGPQNKTVTIMANTEPATTVISLKSNIIKE